MKRSIPITIFLLLVGNLAFAEPDTTESIEKSYSASIKLIEKKRVENEERYLAIRDKSLKKLKSNYMSAAKLEESVYVDDLLKGLKPKGKAPKAVADLLSRYGDAVKKSQLTARQEVNAEYAKVCQKFEALKKTLLKQADLEGAKAANEYFVQFKKRFEANKNAPKKSPVKPREVVVKKSTKDEVPIILVRRNSKYETIIKFWPKSLKAEFWSRGKKTGVHKTVKKISSGNYEILWVTGNRVLLDLNKINNGFIKTPVILKSGKKYDNEWDVKTEK